MNHKTLSYWGPRLLILILAAVAGFAIWHTGVLNAPEGAMTMLGGAKMVHAITPMIGPDMWKLTTMTEAINKLPTVPTKIGSSGLFEERGISTTTAAFDMRDGRLELVGNAPRGSDPKEVKSSKAKVKIIPAAHLPESATVLAEDLDGIRGFGMVTQADAQAQIINDKQQNLKIRLEATREFHRMGALRGQVLDSDGTVINDLFDTFGVTKKIAKLALTNSSTDVRGKILAAKRAVEKLLGGVMLTSWRAYCSADFFDSLTNHAEVKAAFAGWQAAQDRLAADMRSGFTYGGVEFIEYSAEVSGQLFVPEDKACMFPVAMGLYKLYNAPADYTDTVNTIGLPFYTRGEQRKMGRGWDIEAQSNPLAVCTRPEVLTELDLAA